MSEQVGGTMRRQQGTTDLHAFFSELKKTPRLALVGLAGVGVLGAGALLARYQNPDQASDPAAIVRSLPADTPTSFSSGLLIPVRDTDFPRPSPSPRKTATGLPTRTPIVSIALATDTSLANTDASEPTPAVPASEQPPITVALTETPTAIPPTPTFETPTPTAPPPPEPEPQETQVAIVRPTPPEATPTNENSLEVISPDTMNEAVQKYLRGEVVIPQEDLLLAHNLPEQKTPQIGEFIGELPGTLTNVKYAGVMLGAYEVRHGEDKPIIVLIGTEKAGEKFVLAFASGFMTKPADFSQAPSVGIGLRESARDFYELYTGARLIETLNAKQNTSAIYEFGTSSSLDAEAIVAKYNRPNINLAYVRYFVDRIDEGARLHAWAIGQSQDLPPNIFTGPADLTPSYYSHLPYLNQVLLRK